MRTTLFVAAAMLFATSAWAQELRPKTTKGADYFYSATDVILAEDVSARDCTLGTGTMLKSGQIVPLDLNVAVPFDRVLRVDTVLASPVTVKNLNLLKETRITSGTFWCGKAVIKLMLPPPSPVVLPNGAVYPPGTTALPDPEVIKQLQDLPNVAAQATARDLNAVKAELKAEIAAAQRTADEARAKADAVERKLLAEVSRLDVNIQKLRDRNVAYNNGYWTIDSCGRRIWVYR